MTQYNKGDKVSARITGRDNQGNEVVREITGVIQEIDQWGDAWIDPSDTTGLVVNGDGHLGILSEEIVGLATEHKERQKYQPTGGTPQPSEQDQTPESEDEGQPVEEESGPTEEAKPVKPQESKSVEDEIKELQDFIDNMGDEEAEGESENSSEGEPMETPSSQAGTKIDWLRVILYTIAIIDLTINIT